MMDIQPDDRIVVVTRDRHDEPINQIFLIEALMDGEIDDLSIESVRGAILDVLVRDMIDGMAWTNITADQANDHSALTPILNNLRERVSSIPPNPDRPNGLQPLPEDLGTLPQGLKDALEQPLGLAPEEVNGHMQDLYAKYGFEAPDRYFDDSILPSSLSTAEMFAEPSEFMTPTTGPYAPPIGMPEL